MHLCFSGRDVPLPVPANFGGGIEFLQIGRVVPQHGQELFEFVRRTGIVYVFQDQFLCSFFPGHGFVVLEMMNNRENTIPEYLLTYSLIDLIEQDIYSCTV